MPCENVPVGYVQRACASVIAPVNGLLHYLFLYILVDNSVFWIAIIKVNECPFKGDDWYQNCCCSFLRGVYSERKEFAPLGANSFLLE